MQDEIPDPKYLRSITDMTCSATGNTLEEWPCVKSEMEGGKTFKQTDLACVKEH